MGRLHLPGTVQVNMIEKHEGLKSRPAHSRLGGEARHSYKIRPTIGVGYNGGAGTALANRQIQCSLEVGEVAEPG